MEDTWSGVAAYEALCALEEPGFPTRIFAPLADRCLKTESLAKIAKTKPRIKPQWYAPVAQRCSPTHIANILFSPERISNNHLLILEEAEDEFNEFHNELISTEAPLFNPYGFADAVASKDDSALDHELPRFLPALYRALNAAKVDDYAIDEFDPYALVDGAIEVNTYEADMMDSLDPELQPLFIAYLTHLTTNKRRNVAAQKHKLDMRYHRSDAVFSYNAFLRILLYSERPFAPVPFGTNPMINEHWLRRGHNFDSLIAPYFTAQRDHTENCKHKWLSTAEERDVNFFQWAVWDMPMAKPKDLEIPELLELLVEIVGQHPVYAEKKVYARAYPAWELEKVWGEEQFPECLEGDEVWEDLVEYKTEECLKGEVVRKEWYVQDKEGRKDSLSSPRLDAGWCGGQA